MFVMLAIKGFGVWVAWSSWEWIPAFAGIQGVGMTWCYVLCFNFFPRNNLIRRLDRKAGRRQVA